MDAIDEAIAKAQATPLLAEYRIVSESSGREMIVVVPKDVTETELAELAGYLLTDLRRTKRREAATRPAIEVARTFTPARS